MAITAKTQPATYAAGFSPLPLRVFNDQAVISENFKYYISLNYDKVTATAATASQINGELTTTFSCDSEHSFVVGDTLLLNDISNEMYSDNYIVKSVPNSSSVK